MGEFYSKDGGGVINELSLGDKIYLCRRRRGMRQSDLAAAVGLSTPTIRAYESGRIMPSEDRLGDLAKALGTTPEILLSPDTMKQFSKTIKGDSFDTGQELTEALNQAKSIAPRFSINSVTKAGGFVTYKVSCNEVPVTDMVYNIIRLTNGEALRDIYQGIDKAKDD